MFLKLSNRLKGLTNSKKEKVLEVVMETWQYLSKHTMCQQLMSSTFIDFKIDKVNHKDDDLIMLSLIKKDKNIKYVEDSMKSPPGI